MYLQNSWGKLSMQLFIWSLVDYYLKIVNRVVDQNILQSYDFILYYLEKFNVMYVNGSFEGYKD